VGVLVLAVIAFIALDPAEDAATGDAYILAADDICVKAKKEIVAAGRQAAGQGPGAAASSDRRRMARRSECAQHAR
jgi:hypothetical protein